MAVSGKINLTFNGDKFTQFITKLKDLTNIGDIIKIKIDSKNILMYSALSNDVQVLALKNYLLQTSEYIKDFDSEYTYDYIISSSAKIVKSLNFFDVNNTIKLSLSYRESPDDGSIMHVRSGQFSNNKLKITCVGAEQHKIRNLNSKILEDRLNLNLSKWSFNIKLEDFLTAKRLSAINSDSLIISIVVNGGSVHITENNKWELLIDKIEYSNTSITFNKKYLNNINENQIITFYIFESFILTKDENYNLMLSFETDFSDDE